MRIVLIGSGNLATNLGIGLKKVGLEVIQVYSNNISNAKLLAEKLQCAYTNDLQRLKEADVYISAVKDNVCKQVWSNVSIGNKLVLHTSGSVSMEELGKHFNNCGVIYPLMTLSKKHIKDLSDVPFLIEANSTENERIACLIANRLSNNVTKADSEQRAQIHLAAVWANNFSNHMFAVAKTITDKGKLPFSLLLPLIEETCAKIKEIPPIEAQTGPAVRYDTNVIEKQMALTPQEYRTIYKQISESIYHLATQQ